MEGYVNKRDLVLNMPKAWDYDTRAKFRGYIALTEDIDLLDRDKGKEPLLKTGNTVVHSMYADGHGEFEEKHYHDWVCPTCGYFVGELYSGFGKWHIQGDTSYCSRCGQKIDWSLPKEDEKRRYEEQKAKEREELEKRNGTKLDNMYEKRRKQYGMFEEKHNGEK